MAEYQHRDVNGTILHKFTAESMDMMGGKIVLYEGEYHTRKIVAAISIKEGESVALKSAIIQ
jgi:hypothetical protein